MCRRERISWQGKKTNKEVLLKLGLKKTILNEIKGSWKVIFLGDIKRDNSLVKGGLEGKHLQGKGMSERRLQISTLHLYQRLASNQKLVLKK